MTVEQNQICVIQRGIRFAVEIKEECRGWISEVYNKHYTLPDLGTLKYFKDLLEQMV